MEKLIITHIKHNINKSTTWKMLKRSARRIIAQNWMKQYYDNTKVYGKLSHEIKGGK